MFWIGSAVVKSPNLNKRSPSEQWPNSSPPKTVPQINLVLNHLIGRTNIRDKNDMDFLMGMVKWCTKMVITIEVNGSTDKSKDGVSKYTMKKGTDTKENGKEISQTARGKFPIGMAQHTWESSKIALSMERVNFSTFRTKRLLTNFTKMEFWWNKK